MKLLHAPLALLGIAMSLLPARPMAQSMENAVARMGEAGARAYLQPVVTGFGANLNAGWFNRPPRPVKRAFHVRAGLSGSGTLLNSSETMNTAVRMPLDSALGNALIANSSANPAQRDSLRLRLARHPQDVILQGPTVTGEQGDEVKVIWTGRNVATGAPGDSVFLPADTVTLTNLNGLLDDLNTITLFAPQINIGTLYGTEATLRWLPHYESREEIGPIDYFGFGLQHNPAVWLRPDQRLPVDLSVGYAFQSLEGSIFKAFAWSTGLHVSRTYGWNFAAATPYLGAQYERASFEVAYDLVTYESVHRMKTTIEGENNYRLTGGVSLRLLAITFHLDASYARNLSASYSMMIGL